LAVVGAITVVIVGLAGLNGIVHANPTTSTTSQTSTGLQIKAWYDGGGREKLNDITQDLTAIGTSSTNGDWAGLLRNCGMLSQDTAIATAYTPIPDAGTQDSWLKGLAAYNKSGGECVAAATNHDTALITQSNQDMAVGTSFINAATARINTVNGK
jgi:hypothetical protein